MPVTESRQESLPKGQSEKLPERYDAAESTSRSYFFRRQRKAFLDECTRVAVVGTSLDPESASFVSVEKLLGLGLEVIPVVPGCETCLGMRCFSRMLDIPGKVDIVQVYPGKSVNLAELAAQAVEKDVTAF